MVGWVYLLLVFGSPREGSFYGGSSRSDRDSNYCSGYPGHAPIQKGPSLMKRSIELHWDHDLSTGELLETLPGAWLFSDGGILSKENPNPNGVVGAWFLLQDHQVVARKGWFNETPNLSTNDSELDALTRGLEHVAAHPECVSGPLTICIDSGVTFQRFTKAYLLEEWNRDSANKNIVERLEKVVPQVSVARLVLVSGHPPEKEVKRVTTEENRYFGWNPKRGRYWHLYNVIADDLCQLKKESYWRYNGKYDVNSTVATRTF